MKITPIYPLAVLVSSIAIGLGQAEHHHHSPQEEDRNVGSCNQANKQKTLYLKNSYEPPLHDVTEASTSIRATLVEPLRRHNKNGIYEATTFGTKQSSGENGPAGYFGVQWKGLSSQKDMLLFSVWDVRHGPSVIPLATPSEEARGETDLNCKRNCNDCAVHGDFTPIGTGVKCFYNLPRKLEEGDELTLKIERESVQSAEYRLDGVNRQRFTGHVWRVTVEYTGGDNSNFMREQFPQEGGSAPFVLGRILFEDGDLSHHRDSTWGITRLSNFHEHIGCTPCGSFPFEAVRRGPYVLRTARGGGSNVPRLNEGEAEFSCRWDQLGSCTCRKFDARSYDFGEITFMTGGAYHVPHWNPRVNSRMFWMQGNVRHSRDGGSGGDGGGDTGDGGNTGGDGNSGGDGNVGGGGNNNGGGGQSNAECTETYHANGFDCKRESGSEKKACKRAKKTYNSKRCKKVREELGMGK